MSGMAVLIGFGLIFSFIDGIPYSGMVINLFLISINSPLFQVFHYLWSEFIPEKSRLSFFMADGYLAGLSGLLAFNGSIGKKGLLFMFLVNILHIMLYSLNFSFINLLGAQDPGHCLSLFIFASTEGLFSSCIDR